MTGAIREKAVRDSEIFVFGSNLAGRHGKGAALYARRYHGAVYGVASGLRGTSYAIPTKDKALRPLALPHIRAYVREFVQFALMHPGLAFRVTPIGCGLAGYKPDDIAPMFANPPDNVTLPDVFLKALAKLQLASPSGAHQ